MHIYPSQRPSISSSHISHSCTHHTQHTHHTLFIFTFHLAHILVCIRSCHTAHIKGAFGRLGWFDLTTFQPNFYMHSSSIQQHTKHISHSSICIFNLHYVHILWCYESVFGPEKSHSLTVFYFNHCCQNHCPTSCGQIYLQHSPNSVQE